MIGDKYNVSTKNGEIYIAEERQGGIVPLQSPGDVVLGKVPQMSRKFQEARLNGYTILKRIYLANAYTPKGIADKDEQEYVKHCRRGLEAYVAGRIKKKFKVCVVPPIAISGTMADICDFGHGFDEWADDDYTHIYSCDEVWVLVSDGWKESYGVQSEIKFAELMNIPVKYILPDLTFITKERAFA